MLPYLVLLPLIFCFHFRRRRPYGFPNLHAADRKPELSEYDLHVLSFSLHRWLDQTQLPQVPTNAVPKSPAGASCLLSTVRCYGVRGPHLAAGRRDEMTSPDNVVLNGFLEGLALRRQGKGEGTVQAIYEVKSTRQDILLLN